MNELQASRLEKDALFARHPDSPLTPTQKQAFQGLAYFPENASLRLTVRVEEFVPKDWIEMQTSTGDVQRYQRFGRFEFEVDGATAVLTLYRSEHGFFLPFVDALAGTETYPAGRYLDPESLPDGRFLVDFNLAYNPYCAYSYLWSCPITPAENRLSLPIRAGEMIYSKDAAQAPGGPA